MAKKDFDLEAYLAGEQKSAPAIEYKEQEYIVMPEPIQEALGMPGFPKGGTSAMYGLSDCGKTGILLAGAARAQKQGVLPIIIITENKTNINRIRAAGVDPSKAIIKEDLKYLEHVYDYISMKVHEVKSGKLPMDIHFFWDSVAGTPSVESVEITKEGKIIKKFTNQKNANVIGFYNPIIASLIAETRQVDCPHTAGLTMLTQAYVKPPEFPGGPTTIVPNGGEKIWFPLSLVVEVKEGRRLKATHKGRDIEYGLISRLKVKKNHINELNCEGEAVLLGPEILKNDKKVIDEYKEKNRDKWAALLETASKETNEEGEE